MKRILRGLAAVSALASACAMLAAPARAQKILDPNQWIIKGGVSLPQEGMPKRVNNTWIAGGLEYQADNPDGQRVKSVEALYTSAKDDVHELFASPVSVKYSMLSLMLNYRLRQVEPGVVPSGNVLFYGGGLGAQTIWAKIEDDNPGGQGNAKKDRLYGGANLFVGYEIGANFEIEAKYQFVFGKMMGERMNALQLLVGYKF